MECRRYRFYPKNPKRKKKIYPNVEFGMAGFMDGQYQGVLKKYQENNIIQYYGQQFDIKPFYKRASAVVLPSYHEGMANTLLECASMGRPLITSNIHGCKEAIHENGYLCKVQDSQDLYCQLRKFIELDYQSKIKMGLESRKHMEDVFDKNKIVSQTIKHLPIDKEVNK